MCVCVDGALEYDVLCCASVSLISLPPTAGISKKIELDPHTTDDTYLEHIRRYLFIFTLGIAFPQSYTYVYV